jgi:prefoldin beta subunit
MDQKKLQELQMLEQNLQNILLQKQSFQMELAETESAIGELKNAGDEVFKIVGQLMIKSDKKKISEELNNKKKIVDLRMKTIDKQENSLTSHLRTLREEVLKSQEKKK